MSNAAAESLKGTYEQVIIYSCQSAIGKYKFGCDGPVGKCNCEYEPILGSMAQCINTYLPKYKGNVEKAEGYFIESCMENNGVTLTKEKLRTSFENSTGLLLNPGQVEIREDVLYVPILPYEKDIAPKVRDYRAFLGNIDLAQHYGVLINVYWFICLLWFGIFNKIKRNRRANSKLKSNTIDYLRSRISLPLLFSKHMQPFNYWLKLTCLLPTNAEGIILLIYFFLNSLFLVANYDIYTENTIFGASTFSQGFRYVADRSGILAFAHLPLLVIFAGRNNMLISLSGLPYSSFMIFHKWTARVMFIDAGIHSFAYLLIVLQSKSFKAYQYELWFFSGFIAIFASLFLLFFAIHNFRNRYYEAFLVSHIVFALLFFATCYTHCLTFGWLEWVIASVIFWATDRIMRIIRLIKFGAPLAKIQFISDETFKVQVKRKQNWKPYPGCYVFIHFLHPSIFWQSHPFTIIDSVLNDLEVTIYIKAKEGLTSKVLAIIGPRFGNSANMRVSLEGPYGNQSPADNFDNVVLISGGNGIPGPFYHALHLAHTPLIPRQRVRLIWIIRRVDSLKWFQKELELLKDTQIECDIYITRDFDKIEDEDSELLQHFSKFITFHSGRAPNDKILLDEFNNASGTIGIVTCGPSAMCDDVRDFVANSLNECAHRVDLFEELQVW
jgi:ferric-chelate reductase